MLQFLARFRFFFRSIDWDLGYFDHILYYTDVQNYNFTEIQKASFKITQGKPGWQFDIILVLFIDRHCKL